MEKISWFYYSFGAHKKQQKKEDSEVITLFTDVYIDPHFLVDHKIKKFAHIIVQKVIEILVIRRNIQKKLPVIKRNIVIKQNLSF